MARTNRNYTIMHIQISSLVQCLTRKSTCKLCWMLTKDIWVFVFSSRVWFKWSFTNDFWWRKISSSLRRYTSMGAFSGISSSIPSFLTVTRVRAFTTATPTWAELFAPRKLFFKIPLQLCHSAPSGATVARPSHQPVTTTTSGAPGEIHLRIFTRCFY